MGWEYLNQMKFPTRTFKVGSYDPHRFDKDKDGIGCEEGDANESGSGLRQS